MGQRGARRHGDDTVRDGEGRQGTTKGRRGTARHGETDGEGRRGTARGGDEAGRRGEEMARDGEETASESEGWPAGDADETARTATRRGETARDGEGRIIGITKAPLETSSKMRPRAQLETSSKMGEPVEEPMGES